MSPEEVRDLPYRCRRAISAPVPKSIVDGSKGAADVYKRLAAGVSTYLRTGHQPERARARVERLERMQGIEP